MISANFGFVLRTLAFIQRSVHGPTVLQATLPSWTRLNLLVVHFRFRIAQEQANTGKSSVKNFPALGVELAESHGDAV